MKRAIIAVILTALSLASFASAAHANNGRDNDNVCIDNGTKVDVVGNHASITTTAPIGFVITAYCVKAGSAQQGLGPEYVAVNPPQATVTITHSSGKDISHFTVTYELIETPSTTLPPTTTVPPSTTVPVTTLEKCKPVFPENTINPCLPPVTTVPVTTIGVPTTTVEVVPQPETLAHTGSNSGYLVALGLVLMALGLAIAPLRKRA